jgi:hypothetical protein
MLTITGSLLAETPAIIVQAFENMAADSIYDYSYTKTENDGETTKLIKFDATLNGDDCWTLISVNDRKPTKDELKDFYKSVSYQGGNRRTMGVNSEKMYDLTKIFEDDTYIEYKFKMYGDDDKDEKMQQKMDNHIVINKADTNIAKITMTLTEPVSPMLSVKMEKMNIDILFTKMNDTGAYRIKQTTMEIAGKFAVFKKIDRTNVTKYFNYELVD